MRRMRGSAARSEGLESKSVLDSVETLLTALHPGGPGSLTAEGLRRLTRTEPATHPGRLRSTRGFRLDCPAFTREE